MHDIPRGYVRFMVSFRCRAEAYPMELGAFTNSGAFTFCTFWSIAKYYLQRGCERATLYLGSELWSTVGPESDPQVCTWA